MKSGFSTRLPLIVGIWITGGVALLGLGAAALRPQAVAKVSAGPTAPAQLALQPNCRTVATDPQPPLNIRSQPNASSSQNIIGTVKNGVALQVVETESQWLRITQPIKGWVYQPLTTTNCQTANGTATLTTAMTQTRNASSNPVIAQAYKAFEAGNLQTAFSLLETLTPKHPQARSAYATMTQKWQQGNQAYQVAQKALQSGQWQTVLAQANNVPDVSYWHAKTAPIVKQAIRQQHNVN